MPVALRLLIPAAALAGLAAVLSLALLAGAAPDGVWAGLVLEVQAIQRDLHRQLADAIRAVDADGATAARVLIVLSLLYGIFHALGPGHGKIVLSTYLLTQEGGLRRGLLLSLVASLCQGLTAVLAVEVTVGLLGLSLRQAQGTVRHLEVVSFALVALVGALLVVTRGRRLAARLRPAPAARHPSHPDPSHVQGAGAACSACGHVHGPVRADREAPPSLRALAGLAASVGLRPCSGAVLVLLVAHSLQLRWAGIGAAFAMALGTALTVSLLAALSVYARRTALRLARLLPGPHARVAALADALAVAGGVAIFLAGALLLQAAWTAPAHPLM